MSIATKTGDQGTTHFGRNVTDCEEGILKTKRYLVHDRDPLYTAQFLNILDESVIESVKLPSRSPNLNAFAERFVRSIKEECLERMILFVEVYMANSSSSRDWRFV